MRKDSGAGGVRKGSDVNVISQRRISDTGEVRRVSDTGEVRRSSNAGEKRKDSVTSGMKIKFDNNTGATPRGSIDSRMTIEAGSKDTGRDDVSMVSNFDTVSRIQFKSGKRG